MLGRGVTIRFVADPEAAESDLVVVLDEAWTPGPDADRRVIPVRMVFGRVLADHDLWTEARDRLDAWATEGRVPERMTVDGSSFWFHRRLSMWWWLQARLVWLYVIDDLLSGERAGSIELAEDADQALLDVVTAVAARDGATVRLRAAVQTGDEEPSEPDPGEGTEAAPTGPPALGAWPRQLIARVRARHRRWVLKRRRAHGSPRGVDRRGPPAASRPDRAYPSASGNGPRATPRERLPGPDPRPPRRHSPRSGRARAGRGRHRRPTLVGDPPPAADPGRRPARDQLPSSRRQGERDRAGGSDRGGPRSASAESFLGVRIGVMIALASRPSRRICSGPSGWRLR